MEHVGYKLINEDSYSSYNALRHNPKESLSNLEESSKPPKKPKVSRGRKRMTYDDFRRSEESTTLTKSPQPG